MRNVKAKVVGKIKIHLLFSRIFFIKIVPFRG